MKTVAGNNRTQNALACDVDNAKKKKKKKEYKIEKTRQSEEKYIRHIRR